MEERHWAPTEVEAHPAPDQQTYIVHVFPGSEENVLEKWKEGLNHHSKMAKAEMVAGCISFFVGSAYTLLGIKHRDKKEFLLGLAGILGSTLLYQKAEDRNIFSELLYGDAMYALRNRRSLENENGVTDEQTALDVHTRERRAS